MSLRHASSIATSSPSSHYNGYKSGTSSLNPSMTTPSTTALVKFGSRALRSETRAKAKDDIKRVLNAIEKVKKWEKRWVPLNDSTLKIYRWVPLDPSSSSLNKLTPTKMDQYESTNGDKDDMLHVEEQKNLNLAINEASSESTKNNEEIKKDDGLMQENGDSQSLNEMDNLSGDENENMGDEEESDSKNPDVK